MYSFQHEKAREEFKKLAVVDQRMAPLARYLAYRTVVRQASLSDGQVDIHSDLPGYVKEAAHALEKDLKNGDLGDYSYQGRLLLARLYGFSLLPQWRKKSADLLALESSTRTAHEGLTYAIRLFSRASYFGQQDQEGYVSPDIRWFDPDAPVPASHLERWLALVRCDREQKPEQCRKLATQWGGDPRSKAFAIAAALNDVNTPPLLKRLEELVTDPFAGPMARLLSATFLLNLGRRDEATALLRNLEGNSEPELSDAVHALLFEATEDKERRWKHLASLKRVSPRLHRFLEKLPLEELVIYAAHEDPLGFTKALRYYVLARSTVEGKEQVLREVLPLAAATYISSYPDKPSAEYQARKVLIEKYVKTVGSLSSPELLLLATFLTALSGTSPLELQPTTLYYGVCTPLWWCRPGPEGLLGTDYFIKKAEQYLREGPDHELLPAFISRVIWGVRASCASDKTDEKLEQIFRMFQKRYKGSVWARLTPHWYVPSFKPDKGEERYILTADRP